MRVNIIASAKDQDCGISDYTTSLENSLPVNHTRTGVKSNSKDILDYIKKTWSAINSDCEIIHLQHEYGVFGPATIASWPVLILLIVGKFVFGKKVVITMHSAWDKNTPDRPFIHLKRMYIWLNNFLIVYTADHLFFLSKNTMNNIVDKYQIENYSQIPHGVQVDNSGLSVDDARRELGWDLESEIVVLPGYIRPQKGYEKFIATAQADPDRQYIIAGGVRNDNFKPYKNDLSQNAPKNVVITGVLGYDEFRAVFAAADLCYLPYNEATQSGIVNWAFAHGLPVFGSEIEYFQELSVETDAIRVQPKNPKEVSDNIRRFFSNKEQKERMISAAYEYTEQHSMSSVGAKHSEVYHSIE